MLLASKPTVSTRVENSVQTMNVASLVGGDCACRIVRAVARRDKTDCACLERGCFFLKTRYLVLSCVGCEGCWCLMGVMLVLEYECCEAPEKFVVVETEVWTTVAKVDSTW